MLKYSYFCLKFTFSVFYEHSLFLPHSCSMKLSPSLKPYFLPPTLSRFLSPPSLRLFWCPRMSGQSLSYARRSFQARKRRGRRRTRVGKSILISGGGRRCPGRAFVGKSGQHRVKFEPRPTDRLRKIERKRGY